jgi:hypothetical protein
MPEVKTGESRKDYIARCVPVVMKEGLDNKAAVGKCEGLFDSHVKKSALTDEGLSKALDIAIPYVEGKIQHLEKEERINKALEGLTEFRDEIRKKA